MTFDLSSIQKGVSLSPPRLVVYGPHGIGKTTFAANAPAPIGVLTEDGAGLLDVPRFPLATSYDQAVSALQSLQGEHDYQSVFLDSLDHMEPLIWAKVCEREGKRTIEDLGYGKGYVMALDYWRELLALLAALRARGMAVILLAHGEVRRYESPETEPYDRHQIKLHRGASALVQEWADCVFFAALETSTTTDDLGFKNTRSRGTTTGRRILHTTENPAYVAKNRYKLPESIDLSWAAFSDALQVNLS